MEFDKQWRIVSTDGRSGPVIFESAADMRLQAPRVARFLESDVTLFRPDDSGFVPIDTVKWDGLPDVNETIEVTVTFTAEVTTTVRKYDHYGRERILDVAVQDVIRDALENELSYEQPEEHDTIEGPGSAELTGFTVVSVKPLTPSET